MIGQSQNMKIDLHVHVADLESLLKKRKAGSLSNPTGFLSNILRTASTTCASPPESTDGINERCFRQLAVWVRESSLDAIVLLALDAVYDESGLPRHEETVFYVENEFVCSVANRFQEFIFGASIHPYRRDAVQELERLVKKGACLVKWIPSGQYIEPDNPKCFPFYEALAHLRIPLLSHTGVEHTLGIRRAQYNHPNRLVPALEKGVTVIAAHCGVHLFLHEPSYFNAWATLARRYEHLYGDSAAFPIVTRITSLRRILKDPALQTKLLYGSDYPGIPSPFWCWQLGFGKMRELASIKNPLLRNLSVMQALDMPPEVLERAHHQLGISKET
jgi:uncharacterized protein